MRRLVGMVEVRLFDVSRRNVEVGRMQAVERPETGGQETKMGDQAEGVFCGSWFVIRDS